MIRTEIHMKRKKDWYNGFFDGLYTQVLGTQFEDGKTLHQARVVKKLLKARKGQRVLDVPCGMGRLTIPLAKAGLEMTGVDLAPHFIAKARRRAKKERADIRFINSDMRDIDFEEEFDAVFNWFGSFGYFSNADNLAFCRRVFRALKPGGRFLVDGKNKSWIITHFRAEGEHTIGGVHVRIRNRLDRRTGRVIGNWTFKKGKRVERRRSDMRIFNGAEMRALLRKVGFRDIKLYGNWYPVSRFTRHSSRIIAVGTKPR